VRRRTGLSLLGLALLGLSASEARAQVVLQPNQINGQVGFTNQNPAVLAILQQNGMDLLAVAATSTSPLGFSAVTPYLTPSWGSGPYALAAESAAGGPGGVSYSLDATAWVYRLPGGQLGNGEYYFRPVNATLPPMSVAPAGITVDINECVGVFRFKWGYDPTCTPAVAPTSGLVQSLYGFNYFGNAVPGYYYLPAGANVNTQVSTTVGTNIALDTVSFSTLVSMQSQCDVIQDICIVIPQGGSGLGEIIGPLDVIGENEHSVSVIKGYGPGTNLRVVQRGGPASAPVNSPLLWWRMQNMVQGSWGLESDLFFRLGRDMVWLHPALEVGDPGYPVTVVSGQQATGQATFAGQSYYPLVMNPAFVEGSVRLADPYVPSHPGSTSMLETLDFFADYDANNNGIPDFFYYANPTHPSTYLRIVDANAAGHSATSFPNNFDPVSGELLSSYQQVLGNPYDQAHLWGNQVLNLYMWSEGAVLPATLNYPVDPVSFRHGELQIVKDATYQSMVPGQHRTIDHEYCFSEINIQYATAVGKLYNPSPTWSATSAVSTGRTSRRATRPTATSTATPRGARASTAARSKRSPSATS
jgi:hypothetical protein